MKKNGLKGAQNQPNDRQKGASNVEVQGRRDPPSLNNLSCGIFREGALNGEERGAE